MSKGKKSRAWIPFAVIILIILALSGIRILKMTRPEMFPGNEQTAEGAETDENIEESIFAVNTIYSMKKDLNEYLDLNGDVITSSQVDVYPETAGKIVRLPVSVGSYVKKDDVLAWIDPSRPGMNYSESPVRTPISGTVTAVNGNIGSTAAPQAPIVTVGDLSSLQVKVFIPEIYTSRIYRRMPAALSFETFPDKSFSALVTEISPVVDPVSRTMEVKMTITGNREGIKPGMFAKVRLVLEKKENATAVPAGCVIRRFDNTYLFALKGDSVSMVPVVTGITENGFTEILEGVVPGQEIIYQGMNLLEDGAKVRVVERLESPEQER